MRLYFLLIFMFGFCITSQAADDAQMRAIYERVAFARTARDMATWDFAQAVQGQTWVIAKVTPQPGHYETVKEPRIQWDGKTAIPNNTSVVWIVEGTVKVLAPLGTTPEKTAWSYHYERKGLTYGTMVGSESGLWGTEESEQYSPFYRQPGGIVLCSLPDTIHNVETADPKYPRSYLLPADAMRWVLPAQTSHRANPDLFSSERATVNKERLLKLSEDENPFLFAAALRTLAQAGLLEPSLFTKRLSAADRFRQAVLTYCFLYYSPAAAGKALTAGVQEVIGDAENPDEFEGIAIGAYLAYGDLQNFGRRFRALPPNYRGELPKTPESPPSLTLSAPILRTSLEKLKALGVRAEAHRYMFHILTAFPAIAPEYTRTVDKGDHVIMTRIGP